MYPRVTVTVTQSNNGGVESIVSLLNSAEFLRELGKAIAAQIGRRIRNFSQTADGSAIDPNSLSWKEFKGGLPPLVLTGQMTEPKAWDVAVEGNGIVLTLSAEHHEKYDNIVAIANETDRNWWKAFGVGQETGEFVGMWIKHYLQGRIRRSM